MWICLLSEIDYTCNQIADVHNNYKNLMENHIMIFIFKMERFSSS